MKDACTNIVCDLIFSDEDETPVIQTRNELRDDGGLELRDDDGIELRD